MVFFSTDYVPAGTITYVIDSLEIEPHHQNNILSSSLYTDNIRKYAYRDTSGNQIIGLGLSKYMNHTCNPNTLSTGYGFEFAFRDIKPGEQITDDCGMLNIDTPMSCSCQQPGCRWDVLPNEYGSPVAGEG